MSILKFMSRYSTELNLAAGVLQAVVARSGMQRREKEKLYENISALAQGAARVEAYVKNAVEQPDAPAGLSREDIAAMVDAAVREEMRRRIEAAEMYRTSSQFDARLQEDPAPGPDAILRNDAVTYVDDDVSDTVSGEASLPKTGEAS